MPTTDKPHYKVFDFYSGIGGFHQGMAKTGLSFEVVQAFDMNANANKVYSLNYGVTPSIKNISFLKVEDVDDKADIWLMSPPCQVYTSNFSRIPEKGCVKRMMHDQILSCHFWTC